eukprot:TRINITY_DN4767_c0_g1_i4.p1 TRINITY_DN4767_c0_g1~~TRINITY_DN4767_c0_g1_i4.p1  ORF type:complete len:844 (+),score=79.04 TRINITY_DN4767_c0_g1_i4:450-2981(+)
MSCCAKWVDAPVVLVVDGRHGSGMSCAATVKGLSDLDSELQIRGTVLNRMNGRSQLDGMKKGLGVMSDKIVTLGGIPDQGVQVLSGFHGSRYSDLLLNNKGDKSAFQCMVDSFRELVQAHIDVEMLLQIAAPLKCDIPKLPHNNSSFMTDIKIAVARDEAFDSSIEDNLMLMRMSGAKLISFSPLRDISLPSGIVALYLSANMLAQYSQSLAANRQLQIAIKAFAEGGGIVYAEGGGLAYLCRQLEPQCDMPCRMVGILPFRARLCDPQTVPRSYVEITTSQDCPLFPHNSTAKGSVQQQCTIVEERVLGAFSPRRLSSEKPKRYDTCFSVCTNSNDHDQSSNPIPEGYCINDNVLSTQVLINFMSNPQFAEKFIERCQSVDAEIVQQRVLSKLQAYEEEVQSLEQQYQQQLQNKLYSAASVPNFGEPRWFAATTCTNDVGLCNNSTLMQQQMHQMGAFLHGQGLRLRPARSYDVPQNQSPTLFRRQEQQTVSSPEQIIRNKSLSDLRRVSTPVVRESQLYRASHFQADLIVSLSPGATQTIIALGLTQRLAGVTDDCDVPEYLQDQIQLVAFNGSKKQSQDSSSNASSNGRQSEDSQPYVDISLIENMWPGTVIVDNKYSDVLNQLFRMTRTVKVQLDVRTFSGLFESIVQLGEVLDVPDGAKYLVESLQARLRRVARKVLGSKRLPKVALVQSANPLCLGSQIVDEIIHFAGGVNVWSQSSFNEDSPSWEHILQNDPEILVLASKRGLEDAVSLAGSPGWWNIQAVKRGKVYLCDYQMFEAGGPGLIKGVETLAGILHPDTMSDDKFFNPEMVLKMSLKDGQRCRHRMISNFFTPLSQQSC